jgi:isopenicillin-N epimerase
MPTLSAAIRADPQPPRPLGANLLELWHLDPAITFLNHGSFGAVPRAVLEAQSAWRQRLESRPVEMLDRRRDEFFAEAKGSIGRFLDMKPQNFGFVVNATSGVNAVLRSIDLRAGDELLTTTHVYNAVRQTMRYIAERAGATYREALLPLPVASAGEVMQAIVQALSPRTRLLVIDHVTSPSAMVLPIGEIVMEVQRRGVDVLVDGAHAPGMIPLDIETISAAYYTANLHKWVCAPKGSAFLWVRPDRQAMIHPCTISHFLGNGLVEEFGWQGTRDLSPWLSAPAAIEFFERRFGWDRVLRHNHELAVWAQTLLARRWGVHPLTPPDGSMTGSMTSVPLPESARHRFDSAEALQAAILDRFRIEVPIMDRCGQWWLRASCQVYNSPDQYERLATAVADLAAGQLASA